MKTYGSLHYVRSGDPKQPNRWVVATAPHVAMRLKRLFARADVSDERVAKMLVPSVDLQKQSCVVLSDTPEVCEDLRWILERYPMEVEQRAELERRAKSFSAHLDGLADLVDGRCVPMFFDMALPPRDYQRLAAELLLRQGSLLLADHMGLGKTVSAISAVTPPHARPALVVTLTHLPEQWKKEFGRFHPMLNVQVVSKTADSSAVTCEKTSSCSAGPGETSAANFPPRRTSSLMCRGTRTVSTLPPQRPPSSRARFSRARLSNEGKRAASSTC